MAAAGGRVKIEPLFHRIAAAFPRSEKLQDGKQGDEERPSFVGIMMHTIPVTTGCQNTDRSVAASSRINAEDENGQEIRLALIREDRTTETPALMKTASRFCDCVPHLVLAVSSRSSKNVGSSCSLFQNLHQQQRVRKRCQPCFSSHTQPVDSLHAGVSFEPTSLSVAST